jgi:hypothetical protein
MKLEEMAKVSFKKGETDTNGFHFLQREYEQLQARDNDEAGKTRN